MVDQEQIEAELVRFRNESCPDQQILPRDVREVISCVHKHLFDPNLNVQTIKVRCRIRDNNISSRFRREVGITIKGYIESLRLKAASLLLARRVPVFDVALSVGYEHPQTFYRAFQRKFDCTPASLHKKA